MNKIEGRYGGQMFANEQPELPKPDPDKLERLMGFALQKMQELYDLKKAGHHTTTINGKKIELHKKEIISVAAEYALQQLNILHDTYEDKIALRPLYFGALRKELDTYVTGVFSRMDVFTQANIAQDRFDNDIGTLPTLKPAQLDLPKTMNIRHRPEPADTSLPQAMPEDLTAWTEPSDEEK